MKRKEMTMTSFIEPFTSGILKEKVDSLVDKLQHIDYFKGSIQVAKEAKPNTTMEEAGFYHRIIHIRFRGSPGHDWTMKVDLSFFGQRHDFNIFAHLRLEDSGYIDEVEDDPHEYVLRKQPLEITELHYTWTDAEPPESSAVAYPIDVGFTSEKLDWALSEIEEQITSRILLSERDMHDHESVLVEVTTYIG